MPRQDTTLELEGAEFLVLGQLLIQGIPAHPGHDDRRNIPAESANGPI